MVPWLFLAVGLVLGTALGAGILHARSSSRLAVSEASAGERRRQLEQIGAESSDLKAKLEEEQRARVQAETLLQSEREKLQEEQKQFDESRARLSETFQGLAGEALKSNNQAFLELATQTLETLRAQGVGDLDQRKEAIQALVTPLSESLKTYAQCFHDMERRREAAYGDLKGLLTAVQATQENLQHETSNLVTALRRTSVRARWGELTLRRVVELAGMVEHCDFEEQPTVGERETQVRPDMIIRMPGGLIVPVDSRRPSTLISTPSRRLRKSSGKSTYGVMQAMCAGMWPNWQRSRTKNSSRRRPRSRSCLFPARPSSAPPPKPIQA